MLLAGAIAAVVSVGVVLLRLPPPVALFGAVAAGVAVVPLLERAYARARAQANRPSRGS